MNEYHGIGLAAPQVHESLRVFVAGIEEEDPRTGATEIVPIAIINPEVTPIGRDLVEDWEGCLSIPDIRGKVPRNRRIRVRGFDRDGAPARPRARGISRPRRAARDRSPQRRPVLRPHEVLRDTGVPRGIHQVLGEGLSEVASLQTAPPVVTLRNAPAQPFDGAIAAARTCYSPRVVATDRGHRPPARLDRRAHLRRRPPHGLSARALRVRPREHLAPAGVDGAPLVPVLQLRAVESALRQAEGAARLRAADYRRGARGLRARDPDRRGTATRRCRRSSKTTRSGF